jgi:hypothetical protein
MTSYADIIVDKSDASGGGGVLRLSYHRKPLGGGNWKATTVLARNGKKAQLVAWGEDPDDAIYNLCLQVAMTPTSVPAMTTATERNTHE